jgi:hypothetical protein
VDEEDDDVHDDFRTRIARLAEENAMETAAVIRDVVPVHRQTIVEAVLKLRAEFSSIKDELHIVHSENTKLKGELARWQSRCRGAPELDLAMLRRQVSFYCHPDRGGDGDLMSKLNTLFDYLALMMCPQEAKGGSVS